MGSLYYASVDVILHDCAWIHSNYMILSWLIVNLYFYPSLHHKLWLWIDKSFKQACKKDYLKTQQHSYEAEFVIMEGLHPHYINHMKIS